ncbi:MAG: endonuclease/exonuclease/phosphatase family protein [Pseudomonadota bacterium]
MQRVRLITFNIAHGRGLSPYQGIHSGRFIERNLRKITRLLTEARVDFVAMQEVDENSYWNKHINLLDVIAHETPYHHRVMGINNMRDGRQKLNYGNALLSRHPINTVHNQPFAEVTLGGKGFMFAEIDVGGQALGVINLHLDFRSRWRRLEQIEQVISFVEATRASGGTTPVICGDFNCPATRTGDAVHRLLSFLRGTGGYSLLPEKSRTFPAHFPARTIDFVLIPEDYRVTMAEVLPVYLSDHRPVMVEFELPPGKVDYRA